MAWEFHVGQRVVCINDKWSIAYLSSGRTAHNTDRPKRGDISTISDLRFYTAGFRVGALVVFRDTTFLALSGFASDLFFISEHFRPLDERRLDQFRAHLAPAPRQPERV